MSRRHIIIVLAAAVLCAAASPALAEASTPTDVRVTDWVRAFWPIVVVVAGLITTGVLLGLGTRFATAAAVAAIKVTVDKLQTESVARDGRIAAIEKSIDSSPTRTELQEDISELSTKMRGVEVGLEGITGQLTTTNAYLHSLLESGLRRGAA